MMGARGCTLGVVPLGLGAPKAPVKRPLGGCRAI